MFILQPLLFVRDFSASLNDALATHQPDCSLFRIQQAWLSFRVTAVLLSQRICWAQFERVVWAAVGWRPCRECFAIRRSCGKRCCR